jgi:hypothetical protein
LPEFLLVKPDFESFHPLFRQLDHLPLISSMMMGFDPEKEILPGQEWFVKRKWQSSVHALASCLIP